jgi:hypothetical protein
VGKGNRVEFGENQDHHFVTEAKTKVSTGCLGDAKATFGQVGATAVVAVRWTLGGVGGENGPRAVPSPGKGARSPAEYLCEGLVVDRNPNPA